LEFNGTSSFFASFEFYSDIFPNYSIVYGVKWYQRSLEIIEQREETTLDNVFFSKVGMLRILKPVK